MKKSVNKTLLLSTLAISVLLVACKKKEDQPAAPAPSVQTTEILAQSFEREAIEGFPLTLNDDPENLIGWLWKSPNSKALTVGDPENKCSKFSLDEGPVMAQDKVTFSYSAKFCLGAGCSDCADHTFHCKVSRDQPGFKISCRK